MAVRKRGRRKLLVGDHLFVWWVCRGEPEFWLGDVLTVASEKGHFVVRFYLGQQPERRYLVVLGQEFGGLPDAGGCWIRVQCPEWQSGPGIRPADVRRLIEGCLSPTEPRVRMNYRGEVL